MKATIEHNHQTYSWDTNEGVDISIPIGKSGPSAYGIPRYSSVTYEDGGFVGDVNRGGSCNVNVLSINPHGNGSHTECVGHIAKEIVSINSILKEHLFVSYLLSVSAHETIELDEDALAKIAKCSPSALILRTSPNNVDKRNKDWFGSNPPYISLQTVRSLLELNIQHLVVDLPSVDKEDDPHLKAHHAFWQYPASGISEKTITELVFIPNEVPDGVYLLNLQIASIENDASPCKPIIYPLR